MSDKIKIRLFNRDPRGTFVPDKAIQLLQEKAESDESEASENRPAVMEGFATVYDTKTDLFWYTLSIDKKAFDKSIERGDDVVSLFNHDWNYVLGRTPKTLKLDASRDYGLWQETTLPAHDLGRRVLEDITRGALTQQSVSFFIDEYVYSEGKSENELGNLHVTEASLLDVSAVTFGQYPETTLEIQTLYAQNAPDKATFEKLLRPYMDEKRLSDTLQNSLALQLRMQEQRKRKLRGIL